MRKLTHEQAEERLKNKNPTIIFIDKYDGGYNKNNFKCITCDYTWGVNPSDVIHGRSGCPECARKKPRGVSTPKITTDDFKEKVKKVYGDKLSVLGEYISARSRIEVICNKCSNKSTPVACRLIAGEAGCLKCSNRRKGKKLRKSHETYIKEIKEAHDGRISVLDKYTTALNNIKAKCNLCNNIWYPKAKRLRRRGCPNCNISKGELLIEKILKKLKINYETQYVFEGLKTDKGGTPKFDFIIFDKEKIKIIEYDGVQHFIPIKKWGGKKRLKQQRQLDEFKNKYCSENNIEMIRIPYTELDLINEDYIKNLIL